MPITRICKVAESMSISFQASQDYSASARHQQGDDTEPVAIVKEQWRHESVADHQGTSGTKRGFTRGEVEFVFHKRNRLQGDIA